MFARRVRPAVRGLAVCLLAACSSGAGTQPTAANSLTYFHSVNKLLAELRKQSSKTYAILARHYQQYAQQIDELPILGVDPDLLKWGGDVAVTLRRTR